MTISKTPMTAVDLAAAQARGARYHHRSLTRCYVTRTGDTGAAYAYNGRFGRGYVQYQPNWESTTYSFINYYIIPE